MGGYKNSITDIDGKVGINNANPASFLSSARNLVVGSGSGNNGMTIYSQSNAIGDIAFADGTTGSSTYSGIVRYDHSVNAMSIFTSSSEKMRIDSSGNVGIGISPAAKLHLYTSANSDMALRIQNSPSNFYVGVDNTTGSRFIGSSGSAAYIGTTTSSPIEFATANTVRATIDSSGNVGINCNPSQKLQVAGAIATTGQAPALTSSSAFVDYISSLSTARFASVGTTTGATGEIIFSQYSSNGSVGRDAVKIDSSGNVGIAAGGLIAGTITVGRNGNFSSLGAVSDGNATTTAFLNGYSTASGTSNAIIYTNGTYGSQTNTYGAIISDQRYKENIVDASPKLDKIMQVKVRNFNLIGDDLKQIGVIAQEVEQIFPSLVYERELTENIETVDEEGNVTSEIKPTGETAKAVKDSIFTYILLKAVQEQQEIINDLKARIEILENK